MQLGDLLARAPQLARRGAGAAREQLAGRRQHRAARLALEQRGAELALELADAAADRGLGQAELARGGTQAALLGYREEVSNLMQLHVRESPYMPGSYQ